MSEYIVEEPSDGSASWLVHEEIVRCRNCKHYTEDELEYYHFCGEWCEQVEPNGFCAWGCRKQLTATDELDANE